MTVHNSDAIDMLTEMGCSRIVLARELGQKEITDICSKKAIQKLRALYMERYVYAILAVAL